jgi:hypothetical protein
VREAKGRMVDSDSEPSSWWDGSYLRAGVKGGAQRNAAGDARGSGGGGGGAMLLVAVVGLRLLALLR